ncbi:hypothetical protein [Streptodolium elevatio]|uniref:Uncharacterized protein n=1 Tax=Streptodolium elevatio TaxID=3157996 RepID=A0ABV3DJX9_9ACTN
MTLATLLSVFAVLALTGFGWAAHHSSQQRRMAVHMTHIARAVTEQAKAISAIEKRLDGGEW